MNRQGLSYSLRNQIHKDSARNREEMFLAYVQSSWFKLVFFQALQLFNSHTLSSLVAVIYGACSRLTMDAKSRTGSLLLIASKSNEYKALRDFQDHLPDFDFSWIQITPDRKILWPTARNLYLSVRFFSVVKKVLKKHPLYVGMRVARTLFFYTYFVELIRKKKPNACIFSTEGNPHGSALMGACLATSAPSIYVAHSPLITNPGRLQSTIAIFWGAHHSQQSLMKRSKIDSVLYSGFLQLYRPISPKSLERPLQRWGIFLAKDFSPSGIEKTIRFLKSQNPSNSIRLRGHPDTLSKIPVLLDVQVSSEADLTKDCYEVDFVLCGNSTVHLECLLHGVPSFYCPDLQDGNQKPLGFIQDEFIATLYLDASFQKILSLSLNRYQSIEFKNRLSQYLNLQQNKKESYREIRQSILELQ